MKELNRSLEKYQPYEQGLFALTNDFKHSLFYSTNEQQLEKANAYINSNWQKDLYSTIALYGSEHRTTANVISIAEHIVDIDSHILPITKEEAKKLADYLLGFCHSGIIPTPTTMVYSGRGLHLHFNLVDGYDIAKWQATQEALNGTIDEIISRYNAIIGVEKSVSLDNLKDATRFIRIPGTTNTKSQQFATVIYESKCAYTQQELIENYELKACDKKGKHHDLKELANLTPSQIYQLTTKQVKAFKQFKREYTTETLRQARLSDLFRIIRMRNSKGYNTGYRNNLIRIAVQLIRETNGNIANIRADLYEINKAFNEPLPRREVDAWLNSALPKQYYFSNETVIKALNITEAEQEHLKAIISRQVKHKRYYYSHQEQRKADRRRCYSATKEANSVARYQAQQMAKELYKRGYSQGYIAMKLGVSRRTIIRYIKQAS